MHGFESATPANDNNDLYKKFEIELGPWHHQCEQISELAKELADLAARAKLETAGKAQMILTIEMAQLAIALQETLSQPASMEA